MPPDSSTIAPSSYRGGIALGVAAYVLWGLLPLYFVLLAPANAIEIVAWRIIWSLGFCVIALTAARGWHALARVARRPGILLTLAIAAALIFVNWQTYVIATTSGQTVEAAIGYFINPVVTIFLGVVVLRERLRRLQWLSVGISLAAIVVLCVAYRGLPWIALVLAFSFGFYGLVKKRVAGTVDAVSGLAIESAWLAPVAVVELIVVATSSGLTFGADGPGHAVLLVLAGPVTAVPLLLFAASTRRLPLVHIGLIQYLTPLMQFLVGFVVEHESVSPARWLGLGLIWVALVTLGIDLLRSARPGRVSA